MTWLWLLGATLAGAAAYVVGWPVLAGVSARRARDLNTERYLAWRGRAGERPPDPKVTSGERGRLAVAGVLALVAAFCLVGFLTYL
jgi:hypothetical protein